MFCPQCGFRQASSEVQFCSNCGFLLKGVQQLLATGGTHPLLAAGATEGQISPRRKGINHGAVLWLIGAVLVPLLAVLDAPEELIGAVAILCFIGGFVRMVYALLLQDKLPAAKQFLPPAYAAPPQLASQGERASLASPASPISHLNLRDRHATGELIPPPSVTDHTTRLLNKDE